MHSEGEHIPTSNIQLIGHNIDRYQIDWRLCPVLMLLYLFSYIDRANIGMYPIFKAMAVLVISSADLITTQGMPKSKACYQTWVCLARNTISPWPSSLSRMSYLVCEAVNAVCGLAY